MTNENVTPGNWYPFCHIDTDIWTIASDRGLVAHCGVRGNDFSQGNANLLSASKDLHYVASSYVSSCEYIETIINNIYMNVNYDKENMIAFLQQVIFDKGVAMAALSKAAGESRGNTESSETRSQHKGWIPWTGHKESPLPDGVRVAVKYRNGKEDNYGNSESYRWNHAGLDFDIIAYKPILSDEDEAVDKMLSLDCEPHMGMLSRADFCRALYREGWRKLTMHIDTDI